MTLADRLDALLTRPIYECDLETIREAAARLRALETGSGAMTDIVERLREGDFGPTYGPSGIELEAADEITRLRSERSELIEALEPFARYAKGRTEKPLLGLGDIIHGIHVGTEWEASIKFSDCYSAWGILSKIKEQKS